MCRETPHSHLKFQCSRAPLVVVGLMSTSLKTRLKITQLEKMSFIKVNDLKLTQVELNSLFHFNSVAANVSEFYCVSM